MAAEKKPEQSVNEALQQAIDTGQLQDTDRENPEVAELFAAHQKLDSLFGQLRDVSDAGLEITEQQMPSQISHYQVQEMLGSGSFGLVYLGYDTKLDRLVAIKVPRYILSGEQGKSQFLREARAAAQLNHPNIVSVHEVSEENGVPFIVSDYVEGVSLDEWLENQSLSSQDAARLCIKICEAIEHAHQQGVIHRDIKPSNIMIDASGNPHVMDFGLAKYQVEASISIDGKILGTPAYMSPEQARGESEKVDSRSDVYSLGVVLFELLTGERPFRGSSQMLLHQVLYQDAPSPRKFNKKIPRDLETICQKCLEKQVNQRYASAQDVLGDLQRHLDDEPIIARPYNLVRRTYRSVRRHPVRLGFAILVILASSIGFLLPVTDGTKKEPPTVNTTVDQQLSSLRDSVASELLVINDSSFIRKAQLEEVIKDYTALIAYLKQEQAEPLEIAFAHLKRGFAETLLQENRRLRQASSDGKQENFSERRIVDALDDEAIMEFFDIPLYAVCVQLAERHNIPIFIDEVALAEIGLDSSEIILINVRGVTLRSGLNLMLRPKGLTYMVRDEVLKITTPSQEEFTEIEIRPDGIHQDIKLAIEMMNSEEESASPELRRAIANKLADTGFLLDETFRMEDHHNLNFIAMKAVNLLQSIVTAEPTNRVALVDFVSVLTHYEKVEGFTPESSFREIELAGMIADQLVEGDSELTAREVIVCAQAYVELGKRLVRVGLREEGMAPSDKTAPYTTTPIDKTILLLKSKMELLTGTQYEVAGKRLLARAFQVRSEMARLLLRSFQSQEGAIQSSMARFQDLEKSTQLFEEWKQLSRYKRSYNYAAANYFLGHMTHEFSEELAGEIREYRFDLAMEHFHRALDMYTNLLKDDPTNSTFFGAMPALCKHMLGRISGKQGDYSDAVSFFQESIEEFKAIGAGGFEREIIDAQLNLADAHKSLKQKDQFLEVLQGVITDATAWLSPDDLTIDDEVYWQLVVAQSHLKIGSQAEAVPRRALASYQEALIALQKIRQHSKEYTEITLALAETFYAIGRMHFAERKSTDERSASKQGGASLERPPDLMAFENAIDAWNQVKETLFLSIDSQKNNCLAYLRIGDIHSFKFQDFEKGIQAYTKAYDLAKDTFSAFSSTLGSPRKKELGFIMSIACSSMGNNFNELGSPMGEVRYRESLARVLSLIDEFGEEDRFLSQERIALRGLGQKK